MTHSIRHRLVPETHLRKSIAHDRTRAQAAARSPSICRTQPTIWFQLARQASVSATNDEYQATCSDVLTPQVVRTQDGCSDEGLKPIFMAALSMCSIRLAGLARIQRVASHYFMRLA
jgi:hypothetical protein